MRKGAKPAKAEDALEADLEHLTDKLKSGRPLTPGEQKALASLAESGRNSAQAFVKTQVELAQVLGVDRKTIQRWRKIDGNPGAQADGRWNVEAWRAFALAQTNTIPDGSEMESLAVLKAKNLLLQNSKLEHQIAVMKREYVPAGEVERWGGELGAAIRKIAQKLHLIAPTVVGMQVADAEKLLREKEDEILSQLHLLDESISDYAKPGKEEAQS